MKAKAARLVAIVSRPGRNRSVVGVGKDDARVDFAQIARGEAFHRRGGAHGHERRRFQHAVSEGERAAPRGALTARNVNGSGSYRRFASCAP